MHIVNFFHKFFLVRSDLQTTSETFQHNSQEQSESVYYHISGDQEISEQIYSIQGTNDDQKR